ncbi:MAG: cbb3-type cytochrome c oxidase subunit I [Limisphaerales bacterium]
MNDSDSFEKYYSTAAAPVDEIEKSVRWPVVHTVTAAALWLFIGTALSLIASFQLVYPSFLADCRFLNYGHTKTAAWNILLYGFAIQMVIAFLIYLVHRRSQTRMRHAATTFVASKLWNLGVFLGALGIFLGDATGHAHFGMPGYAYAIMAVAFFWITIKTLVALHYRTEREFYISQAHLGAGAIWFMWMLSTALILLHSQPVAGVAQLVISKWYSANLFQVVIGGAGLSVIYYYLPQIAGRPLFSKEYAFTAFWCLIFFGSWTGISGDLPLPAWITGLSSAFGILLIVPLLLVLINVWMTIKGNLAEVCGNADGRFLLAGTLCYTLWMLQSIVGGFTTFSGLYQFTHYSTAVDTLFIYGFAGLTFMGGCCSLMPRLTGQSSSCEGAKIVFTLIGTGLLVSFIALREAGIQQNIGFEDANFMTSVASARVFLQTANFGGIILLVGSGMFLFGMLKLTFDLLATEFPLDKWLQDEPLAGETGGAQE